MRGTFQFNASINQQNTMKKIKGQLRLNGISEDGKPYVPSAPLKEWLGDHPQTQESLGAWLGVSGSIVSTWIRDGRMPVYIGLVIALARSNTELTAKQDPNPSPFFNATVEGLQKEVQTLEAKLEEQQGRVRSPRFVLFTPKSKEQLEYLERTAGVMNLQCSVIEPA